MDLLNYCRLLPKIELHAHLTGSVSDGTLRKLVQERGGDVEAALPNAVLAVDKGHNRTLENCFEVFKILHLLVNNLEVLDTVTREVIQEFASDGVCYLELRTTPRNIDGVMTKLQYIETVLHAVCEEEKQIGIEVNLLLSIDRAQRMNCALDTVDLALEYSRKGKYAHKLIGLDVSGNPSIDNLVEYLPLLQKVKDAGLKLSLHLAEVPNEKETAELLKSGVLDRIGHGTCIHMRSGGSSELTHLLKSKKIPLEICLTSNLKTGTIKRIEDHHFRFWRDEGHPLVLCTDDKGVFGTSLSEEFYLCAKTFALTKADLNTLCLEAVAAAFISEEKRSQLKSFVTSKIHQINQEDHITEKFNKA